MSPLLNRANISSTYGSKVAALRRQANASGGGGGGYSGPSGDAIFTTVGAAGWMCPAGVTAARVVVIGGGGSAGTGVGGGGGGAALKYYTNLVPGTNYQLTVGGGGNRNATTGNNGGTSEFQGPTTLTATGGAGGGSNSSPAQTERSAGGVGSGGDINGVGGKGYPSANMPVKGWSQNLVPSFINGTAGGAGGGAFGADNDWGGHGGAGSMYAGGGGGGGTDNELGGDGGVGGLLTLSEDGTGTQRGFGGGGGGTDGTHITGTNRDGSGGGTLGGFGGMYGGNAGEAKDSAHGGSGGNYTGSSGGEGGHGVGQQGGGGGGGSFGGGGACGRYTGNYGGGGADGLVYIRWGLDKDGTLVDDNYPVPTTISVPRMDKIYHTWGGNGSQAQAKAPFGIKAGDLLIIMEYGPDVTSSITGNIPTGFTKCSHHSEHAAVDQRMHYKVADGQESGVTFTGQTGSNNNMHFYVFRGQLPLYEVTEQGATSSNNQTGSGCTLSMTINQPSSPASPYVFSLWTAGNRGADACYISGTNPATTATGSDGFGGNGWYHNPSLDGKHSDEVQCFSWRLDDTSGGAVNRDVSWTYGSTSRNTSLAMKLNLTFQSGGGNNHDIIDNGLLHYWNATPNKTGADYVVDSVGNNTLTNKWGNSGYDGSDRGGGWTVPTTGTGWWQMDTAVSFSNGNPSPEFTFFWCGEKSQAPGWWMWPTNMDSNNFLGYDGNTLRLDSNGDVKADLSYSGMVANQLYCVYATMNKGGKMNWWVNGIFVGESTFNADWEFDGVSFNSIDRYDNSNSYQVGGKFYFAGFYNRALTPAEIKSNWNVHQTRLNYTPPAGQSVLTTAGNSTTWTCPQDVFSVHVVCIGAGGGWTDATGDTTITFGSVTLTAEGGKSRNTNASAGGGASGGDQNWTGGAGYSSSYGAGGGGAAGYSGNGQQGCGGTEYFANTYVAGSGSGAGGGSYTPHSGDGGGKIRGGGGVGMYGKGPDATDWSKGGSTAGLSGADASSHNGATYYGGGGGVTGLYGTRTGGGGGLCWKNNIPVVPGTTYNAYIGGGGNGGSEVGAGGEGVIRIIWGANRAFPDTNTADV